MSKRFNKQNRGNRSPQNNQSNKGMTERKKKIYAYILAGFIIFWNVACVLGIVAFVRSFAKNDSSSEEQHYTALSTKNALFDEPYQEVDLHTSGVSWALDESQGLFPCFSLSAVSVRFYEEGFELRVGGFPYYRAYGSETYTLSVPFEFYGLFCNEDFIYISPQLEEAFITYTPAYSFVQPDDDYDRGSFVRRVNCSAVVVHGDGGFSFTYVYELRWYDFDGVYLGSDELRISPGYKVYDSYVDIFYPFTSTFTTVSTPTTVDCGHWLTYFDDYYSNGYNNGYSYGYSNGYDIGYDDGLDYGYDDGYGYGYDDGYDYGYDYGYDNGYESGVVDANTYTFERLLTSVIDVPVKAFTSLFNFEILGVNLSDFFFGLLSVCAIIVIIKLFL